MENQQQDKDSIVDPDLNLTSLDTLEPIKQQQQYNPNSTHCSSSSSYVCRRVEVVYEKLNRVGEGTYGVVYRARHKTTGAIAALKKMRIQHDSDDGLPISSLREIALLKRIRHANIVSVLDVVVGRGIEDIFMVMEYCEQDMAQLLDGMLASGLPRFRPAEVKCLMKQLLDGVKYLHDVFIIHRDLKMSNLLLTKTGVLKIADFGLARRFQKPLQPMTPRVVTLWYRAPELLFSTSPAYTPAIDLWSCGCILGEWIRGKPLLPARDEWGQIRLICELLGVPSDRVWPGFEELMRGDGMKLKLPDQPYCNTRNVFPNQTQGTLDLINALLTYSPALRITASAALQHAYFKNESPRPVAHELLPTYPEIRNMSENEFAQFRAAQERFHQRQLLRRGDDDDDDGDHDNEEDNDTEDHGKDDKRKRSSHDHTHHASSSYPFHSKKRSKPLDKDDSNVFITHKMFALDKPKVFK